MFKKKKSRNIIWVKKVQNQFIGILGIKLYFLIYITYLNFGGFLFAQIVPPDSSNKTHTRASHRKLSHNVTMTLIKLTSRADTGAETTSRGHRLVCHGMFLHGMQDALGRKSGRLPNLIGICWLIAWFWLTRCPVVLCKQESIAGKSERACRPLWCPLSFAFPVLAAVAGLEKKKKSLLCTAEPQSLPYLLLQYIRCPWKCQNIIIFFFSLLYVFTALTQSVMCLSLLEKVQTFSLQALCEASGKCQICAIELEKKKVLIFVSDI